jgi:hypothetical protein
VGSGAEGTRHWLRWTIAGVAAVFVVAIGVVASSYVFRSHPGPKTINQALTQFRRTGASADGGASSSQLPAPGVYAMSGTGSEKISFPPNSQADGATMPVSVQLLGGGCFRWRVDYNQAYWQDEEMCHVGQDLVIRGFRNDQRWDFGNLKIDNTAQFTCDPPQGFPLTGPVGASGTGRCSGGNTAEGGKTVITSREEIVGRGALRVGATTVEAVHLQEKDRSTGAQTGDQTTDWWIDAQTGLPVRVDRSYRLDSPSPVGTVTYTEEGHGQIEGMTPTR